MWYFVLLFQLAYNNFVHLLRYVIDKTNASNPSRELCLEAVRQYEMTFGCARKDSFVIYGRQS